MKLKNTSAQKAKELTTDPQFLSRVAKKMSELGMVGEEENGLIVFLSGITTILHNPKRRTSTLVTGSSGGGKSKVIETPLKLFPKDWVVRRASLTEHALVYNADSLDGKVLYVTEYDGGRQSQYYLRLLQSEGDISREFTVGRKTEVVQRLGSPVVLTATTREKIFPDDATRFLTTAINETPEHNLAVFRAELNGPPKSKEPAETVWHEAIQLMKDRYEPFVFPDWFGYLAEQVPRDKTRSKRDWNRFLGLVEAIAICNPDPNRDGKITPADYCIGFAILESALAATNHAVNENELSVRRAVEKLMKDTGRAVTIKEIRENLDWDDSMTYKWVRAAVKHALITYESGTAEKNVKRLLPVEETSSTFLPSPRRIIRDIKEFGPSVKYIDPVTGAEKTIVRAKGAVAGK